MDRATRVERCAAFIGEFGDDYRKKLGFGIGRRLVVVRESLGYDDHDQCVRYEVVVRPEDTEEDIRFFLEPAFFAPEDRTDHQAARVAGDLEMDLDQVRQRFEAARLAGRRH